MPYTLGSRTKVIFERGPEAHKLHVAFEVDVELDNGLQQGQLVKLTALGSITGVAISEPQMNVIGVVVTPAEPGDMCTVAVRGYAITFGQLADVTGAGPVEAFTFSQITGNQLFQPCQGVDDADKSVVAIGWALAPGILNDIVKVLIKD